MTWQNDFDNYRMKVILKYEISLIDSITFKFTRMFLLF